MVIVTDERPRAAEETKEKLSASTYLGSVRFFRHMIFFVIFCLISAPLVGVLWLSGQMEQGEQRLVDMEKKLGILLEQNEQTLALKQQEDGSPKVSSAYGQLHPELGLNQSTAMVPADKLAYLTFDDGPGSSTWDVLDILNQYDVKATFFVVGREVEKNPETLQAIAKAGHTIGVHTYTHEYEKIYASVESYLDDFAATSAIVEKITGKRPEIFRFPGGSVNAYNMGSYQEIASELLSRGYRYYDWNVGSGDTAKNADSDSIANNVLSNAEGKGYAVVLMHDGGGGRARTVKALPEIIRGLKQQGFEFAALDRQVQPTVFGYDR